MSKPRELYHSDGIYVPKADYDELNELLKSRVENVYSYSMMEQIKAEEKYDALLAQNKLLVEALEFYAAESNWCYAFLEENVESVIDRCDLDRNISKDFNGSVAGSKITCFKGGKRARQALSKVKGEG